MFGYDIFSMHYAHIYSFRSFCENIEYTNEDSGLHKVLAKKSSISMTNPKKRDGIFTESEDEKVRILLAAHFPGSFRLVETATDNIESLEGLTAMNGLVPMKYVRHQD